MIGKANKKEQFQVFDSAEDNEPLRLVTTSNKNIRKVCQILCNSVGKTEEERMYYAEQGEIQPETDEETGDKVYRFSIEYPTINVMWAALTEALFYGAPELVKWNEESEEYEVADKKKVDELIRGEVQSALVNFFDAFGKRLYEDEMMLGLLPNDLITNLRMMDESRESSKTINEIISNVKSGGGTE